MAIKQNKTKQKSDGEDVEKLEPSYIDSGNVKWCGHYRKQGIPYKLKHSYHVTQQFY